MHTFLNTNVLMRTSWFIRFWDIYVRTRKQGSMLTETLEDCCSVEECDGHIYPHG